MFDLQQFHENSHRRIACPISWCEGRWFDHGGEGQSPDDWDHTGESISLHPSLPRNSYASVSRMQWGSRTVGWSGEIKLTAELYEDGGPALVAATLRAIADELDRVTGCAG